ncbi:unnamed protein product [Cylindrotheca closterium]|uniref:Uncharacterized protein n=1 Tax=Cylindrotheca closterium TaxID=2856 RepID=A0AAD2FTT7_9STRA|nr:unnamed protein product [Cylindrotheca closterium]
MPTSLKRSVKFNPNVTGVGTISIYDYTTSEIAATWYDEEEMDSITRRCVRIIKRMETNDLKEGNAKYCTRGLEGHTMIASSNKRRNRSSAVSAVLDEQARQWDESKEQTDAQAIADVYARTTSSCQMWAQVMGNRDQVAAAAFLYKDDDDEESKEVVTVSATTSSNSKSRIELSLASTEQITLREVRRVVIPLVPSTRSATAWLV